MFKKLIKKLPKRPLTNIDILECAKHIPYFRGVFMKDKLPKKLKQIECGIVNLDNSTNKGTHWVAYVKLNNYCEYFDSYGNLKPPLELLKYLKRCNLFYNYNRFQNFNAINCGHLCLEYLLDFWNTHSINC